MQFVTITPYWKRFDIALMHFESVREFHEKTGSIHVACVSPEDEEYARFKKLFKKHRWVHVVECSNEFVSDKWNKIAQELEYIDFDYAIQLGSDDLINAPIWLDDFSEWIGHKLIFGYSDMYFRCTQTNRLKYWESETMSIGAGRAIHRYVLETMGFKFHELQKNRGLDGDSRKQFENYGFGTMLKKMGERLAVCDLKSDVNIWDFDSIPGVLLSK